jgi:hypothetical protein
VNEQPPSNMQFDRPSDQASAPTPKPRSARQSRIGWYLLGCFVLLLIVVALCVLGGLFVAVSPAGGK